MAPKKSEEKQEKEVVTLGPQVKEGEIVFGVAHIFASFNDTFVHVTDDPDRAWAEIGQYLFYETKTYASFQTPGQHSTPVVHAADIEGLRTAPNLWVDTPDGIVARVREAGNTIGALNFHPLAGGLPPRLAWESLELFATRVQPHIN